jgi:hypothetical protein
MPRAVSHTAFAVDEQNHTIWIAGGFEGDHPGVAINNVFMYSALTNQWIAGPPLPAPRAGGAMVRLGRILHYFGGYLPDRQTNSSNHWALDLDNLAAGWTSLAPLPVPRGHLAGVVYNEQIYAIGGQINHDTSPQATAVVHRYNPATDTWTQRANMPIPTSHIETSTFVFNNRIIVAAGTLNTSTVTNSIIEYNPATNSWRNMRQLPMPLTAVAVTAINGQVYVAGGKIDGNHPQSNTWVAHIYDCDDPVTPTNTPTQTNTPTATNTSTPSNTPTKTNTPTATNTSTPSNTSTEIDTPTVTNTPTASQTPTVTLTPSDTPIQSDTLTPSDTPDSSGSPALINTPTETDAPTPVDALDLTATSAPNVSSLTIVTVTPENALTQSDIDQLSEVSPLAASAISQGDEVTIVLSGALAGNSPGLPGDQIIWTITLSNVGTDVITMTLVNQIGDELHLDSITVNGGSISVDGTK